MCELCHSIPCHPRCPNSDDKPTRHICGICREPIYVGEEFAMNSDGGYAHTDCVEASLDTLIWCGCSNNRRMEDDNDDYEEFY